MFGKKTLYFIRSGDYVKVGTSRFPSKRLEQLQTGNPEDTYIIAEFPEQAFKEFPLHKYLSHLHIRGEWYRYTSEIDEIISTLTQREYELSHWEEVTANIKKSNYIAGTFASKLLKMLGISSEEDDNGDN